MHFLLKIMCVDYVVYTCISDGVNDIIVAIAHRGRLNLLTLLMKYPAVDMFRKVRYLPLSDVTF